MGSFEMARPQGFALEESVNYLTRFRAITAASDRDGLDLAFAIDGSWEPVGLRVCEHGDAFRIEILANPEDADEHKGEEGKYEKFFTPEPGEGD